MQKIFNICRHQPQASASDGKNKKKPVKNISTTIATCKYLTKNKEKPSKKHFKKLKRSNKEPPVIVVEEFKSVDEDTKKVDSVTSVESITKLLVQRRDSLKKIVKKAKEKKGQKRKNIDGEMSHIKAKWLLGLSVTMVNVLYEIVLICYSTEMQEHEPGNDFQAP